MKKGFIEKVTVSSEDLELINKFTKRPLTADEVYTFSVILCDNEIDRDFERFTPEAIAQLSVLFLGKTGIFDHSMKGRDQIARIYECHAEKTGELLGDGTEYVCLKAKAYLPKTDKTKEFILNLDAGIIKEVSVGCAVKREVCSICGADVKRELCEHRKGKTYGEGANMKQCYYWLDEPYDAYEWSFVAVPAQRRAGVVKAYSNFGKGETDMNVLDVIKGFGNGEVTLTALEAEKIKNEFEKLEKTAKGYIEAIKTEAVKVCSKSLDTLPAEVLGEMLERLEPEHIKAFTAAVREKHEACVQLAPKSSEQKTEKNDSFVI